MEKQQVVATLSCIGKLFAVKGDAWRSHSFLAGARAVSKSAVPLDELAPGMLAGVGEGIIGTIRELRATGTCQRLQSLERSQTAKSPKDVHSVTTVDELEALLVSGQLSNPKLLASIRSMRSR
jgi:DNA polymerase/3'-5' exonuclease PolX